MTITHAHQAGRSLPVRTVHAELTTDVPRPVEEVFDTFTGFARYDLWAPDIPASVSRRLESLQEAAPRFPFAEARRVVEEELEAPLAATFRDFRKAPIASASLSQVYFATLSDNRSR